MIRPMKTLHTHPCLTTPDDTCSPSKTVPKQNLLIEDMSLVSDDEEVSAHKTEELLIERTISVD